MVCPYRVAMIGLTVVFAALFGLGFAGNPSEEKPAAGQRQGGWLARLRAASWLCRAGYALAACTLLIFHFEIFSGGYICRSLFASH
eukprot:m.110280 g.110280  ORF g.110280 m.110280 type:complete len:86 (-) comp19184_c0_seq1:73-330(-)